MSRDLRGFAQQTNRRLLIGFILLLLILGDGLIYVFYGQNAAIMGLVCLLLGLGPAVLIWLVLVALGWVVKKVDE
jgi:hypothetical protein